MLFQDTNLSRSQSITLQAKALHEARHLVDPRALKAPRQVPSQPLLPVRQALLGAPRLPGVRITAETTQTVAGLYSARSLAAWLVVDNTTMRADIVPVVDLPIQPLARDRDPTYLEDGAIMSIEDALESRTRNGRRYACSSTSGIVRLYLV